MRTFKLDDKDLLKELLILLNVRDHPDEICEEALREFGTLRNVLGQNADDLKRISGFSPPLIKKLKTIYSIFREVMKPEAFPSHLSRPYQDLTYFIHTAPKWDGECLRLVYLNENNQILKDFIYKKGAGTHVQFYLREIVKEVLKAGIAHLAIIHHKMSGPPEPSQIDHHRFKEFKTGLKALDITLVDYLIITDNQVSSFRFGKK